jgi:ribosome maturation factor RimP
MEELKLKLKEIIEGLNYYLYDITYEKEGDNFILRVMIENDRYINIDDCVLVSREISEILDEIDPFPEPYMMEVTSGGAERELRDFDEVKRAVGKPVYIETMEQKMEGMLEKFDGDFLVVKHKNKRVSKVQYIDVSFIRLTIML